MEESNLRARLATHLARAPNRTKSRATNPTRKTNGSHTRKIKVSEIAGFSLIEALVVFSIIALLSAIAIPNLSQIVTHSQIAATELKLRRSISAARNAALSSGEITTLCGGEHTSCEGSWERGYLLFVDNNNDGVLDAEEELLERSRVPESISIDWRASGRAPYLKFSPSGMARQFGRFHICHQKETVTESRGLVINRQGRVRAYKDRDGSGRYTDINGQEPICD